MAILELTKHHGLGNDFLVVIAPPDDLDLAAAARALCDRRRGLGADGLIAAYDATRAGDGASARMVLHNADGGRAEMSGNGIRCLAQALVDGGWAAAGPISIATDAGDRAVEVSPEHAPGARLVRVGMGTAKVVRLDAAEASVDTGNPHLVLRVDDFDGVDLRALGAQHPDVNVEVVRVDDRSTATMLVHERGVGVTEACGTGSVAAAAATAAWGLTGDHVVVNNPGGPLTVDFESGDQAWLTGPTQRIATARVESEVLAAWR